MNDEKIIKSIQERNEQVMSSVIDKYSKLLWKVTGAVLAGASEQDMEECIADVFVELWINPNKFDPNKGKLSSYLSMIARNKAIDRYRSIARKSTVSLDDMMVEEISRDKSIIEQLIDDENKTVLQESIKELDSTDQDILIRRYYYDQKPREISEALTMSKKQVENRLYLAKQALRKKMKENGYAQI